MERDSSDTVLTGARGTFLAAALFSLFANLLVLAVPLFTLQVYDRVLASRSGATLAMLSLAVVIALAVHFVLDAARSRLMVHVAVWLDRRWAPELLERAVRRAPLDGNGGGQGLGDLATVRGFVTSPGIGHLLDAPWVPIYVGVMFLLHPALGWLAVGGAVLLFGMATLSELATRRSMRAAAGRLAAEQRGAEDLIRRAEAVEAMGMLPGVVGGWREQVFATRDTLAEGWHRGTLLASTARFLRFLVQVAVIALGATLAIAGELTAGAMIAGAILLSRALAPVESLVGSWKGFVAARAALTRLNAELRKPSPRRGSTRLPTPNGRLVLDRVRLTVPGRERPILDSVGFELPAGESLGIIGPSAAGKSTLARVVLGLIPPTEGRARLDGADVAAWCREDLGRHIGYLPQDIELFPGTVKRNIARMGEPDDDAVIAAARLAGVHEMILALPAGYDTEIGDTARTLSGGQRQRLAMARAFYGGPRLLVLDEPNSNLDADGEAALIRALGQARERGVTTVLIAHRASILMTVDHLLLLRDGRAELFGRREEVLARLAPPRAPRLAKEAS